jgi:hypothetical protein
VADDDVNLYEGTALPLDESYGLANAFPTRAIVVMGEKDAGKTTLVAEIHHAYLKAPFAGFLFAGSRTLIGFEERCFLSRLNSEQTKEDTERTKYADIRLLHLSLAPASMPQKRTHLLLTDVSGERFKEVRTSVEEARELAPLIQRADTMVLLVDGDRLSLARTQMTTETNACVLLRCLMEAGGLSTSSCLDVVISKWDFMVLRSAEARLAQLEDAVRKVTGPLVPRFHRVAARVKGGVAIAPGFGVSSLVEGWMREKAPSLPRTSAAAEPSAGGRWYHRYRYLRVGE